MDYILIFEAGSVPRPAGISFRSCVAAGAAYRGVTPQERCDERERRDDERCDRGNSLRRRKICQ